MLAPAPVSSIDVIENVLPGVLPTVAVPVSGKHVAPAHPHSSLQPYSLLPAKEGAEVRASTPASCCKADSVGTLGAGRLSGLVTAVVEAANLVGYESTPPRRLGGFGLAVFVLAC